MPVLLTPGMAHSRIYPCSRVRNLTFKGHIDFVRTQIKTVSLRLRKRPRKLSKKLIVKSRRSGPKSCSNMQFLHRLCLHCPQNFVDAGLRASHSLLHCQAIRRKCSLSSKKLAGIAGGAYADPFLLLFQMMKDPHSVKARKRLSIGEE